MRVIAGKFKGHRLFCPPGRDVRPTLDRVKEAIFSKISYLIDDSMILDLFSGCGNLGIEALSRGAEKIYFCESDPKHVNAIKKNLNDLEVNRSEVEFSGEVFKALKHFSESKKKFDIIFADPPYLQNYKGKDKGSNKILIVNYLLEDSLVYDLMDQDSVLIVEHQKDIILPEDVNNLICYDRKNYGTVSVSYYKLKI